MSTEWLSPSQVAARYGLPYRMVLRLIHRGEVRAMRIPGVKPDGNRYRIPRAELAVFEQLHSTSRRTAPRIAGEAN